MGVDVAEASFLERGVDGRDVDPAEHPHPVFASGTIPDASLLREPSATSAGAPRWAADVPVVDGAARAHGPPGGRSGRTGTVLPLTQRLL